MLNNKKRDLVSLKRNKDGIEEEIKMSQPITNTFDIICKGRIIEEEDQRNPMDLEKIDENSNLSNFKCRLSLDDLI